jgi:hypothetical protein
MAEVIETCQQAEGRRTRQCENMNVAELREISGTGLVTLGAHTMNHPILLNEQHRSCVFEVTESVQQLAALLDRPVFTFAYPNGMYGLDFGEREQQVLRECGVRMAFTTDPGRLSAGDNPLRIPRIAISDGEPLNRISLKLAAGSLWVRVKKLAHAGEEIERRRLDRVLRRRQRAAALILTSHRLPGRSTSDS